jgi:hypothetical protein
MKMDVLSAVHFTAEVWKFVTPTAIKNCFVKCGFSVDHASNSDGSAVKLTEEEKHDWHILKDPGVHFEKHMICDSVLKICGVQSIQQVLNQQLTRPEEELEEEIVEDKTTFLDALKGLEAVRKYLPV